jgi:hypothetical protein
MEICKGTSFVRHGGVDYVKQGIIYADEWNIVRAETQKEYNIQHIVIQPTIQDISKTQVLVKCDDLRVRKGPSTTAQTVGFALPGYYDVEMISETPDITWANVANTDYWIAANLDGDSELLEASFVPVEPDEAVDQIEITIDDLRIRLEPSTSAKILGYAPEGYYNVEASESGSEYVWIKTCGYWVACVDGVTYHAAKEDPKDKRIAELEAQVAELTDRCETQARVIKQQIEDFESIRVIAARNIPE